MRRLLLALTLFAAPASAETIGDMDVCFTPGPDDCAIVAVEQINAAERTIDMQAYNFTEPHIAHNKVMVIDGQTVLTGSFNWSTAADKHNAENLLTIHDPRVAQAYDRNFRDRLEDSETLAEYEEYQAYRGKR